MGYLIDFRAPTTAWSRLFRKIATVTLSVPSERIHPFWIIAVWFQGTVGERTVGCSKNVRVTTRNIQVAQAGSKRSRVGARSSNQNPEVVPHSRRIVWFQ